MSQGEEIISSPVGYPTMGLGSIVAVIGPIDFLFRVNTINRMTMLLFYDRGKRLVALTNL
jgi:hypothetical protein